MALANSNPASLETMDCVPALIPPGLGRWPIVHVAMKRIHHDLLVAVDEELANLELLPQAHTVSAVR
jgi:hypothetical protein